MSSEEPNNKRRRLSDTSSNNHDDDDDIANIGEEKTAQTSKCKGGTTIPIFLKKTYKMVDTCDEKIAAWTADGDMFVVKDPDLFASDIIPQYFDHNKFSSFARQLNFYGFRKMQSKPIRNSDFDSNTAKHVTFYNENFKRGRCDLLKKITRSTRGGGNNSAQDHQREVQQLKEQVTTLENKVADMTQGFEERMRRLELDMLGRMEQMMLAMAQQQQTQLQLQQTSSIGGNSMAAGSMGGRNFSTGEAFEPLPFGARGASLASGAGMFSVPAQASAAKAISEQNDAGANGKNGAKASGPGPTLPPHPKQKPLPPTLPPHPKQMGISPPGNGLPGSLGLPPSRLSSLARGLSRGLSNLSRGVSVESSASAALLRNSWEDKFFSMLMSDQNEAAAAAAAQNAMANNKAAMGQGNGGMAGGMGGFNANEMQNLMNNAALQARALSIGGPRMSRLTSEMSAMSNSGGHGGVGGI